MKIYINDRITEKYGTGVIIVVADNEVEAEWLSRDFVNHKGEPLFESDGWRPFSGVYPDYLQTEAKILYHNEYIE